MRASGEKVVGQRGVEAEIYPRLNLRLPKKKCALHRDNEARL